MTDIQQELVSIESSIIRFLSEDYLDNKILINDLIEKLLDVSEEESFEEIRDYISLNEKIGKVIEDLMIFYKPDTVYKKEQLLNNNQESLSDLETFNDRLERVEDLPIPQLTEENAERVNLAHSLVDNIVELIAQNKRLNEGLSLVFNGIKFIFENI